jgi:broad specificity phosphatase PhoE
LGQTDAPLSEEGRAQAAAAAEKLAGYGAGEALIYSSDLCRAFESAGIIAARLRELRPREARPCENSADPTPLRAPCPRPACTDRPDCTDRQARRGTEAGGPLRPPSDPVPDRRLREMHLGDWEGRFIREIKEDFPEEYAQRGANLLNWKRGHAGENYYDLRYRVLKGLRAALRAAERAAARETVSADESAAARETTAAGSAGGGAARETTAAGSAGGAGESAAARDLIFVAHSGVIKVVIAEFAALRPESAWGLTIARGAVIQLDIAGGRALKYPY